jgi:hypothetical protein
MRTDKELNELRRISDWPRRWLGRLLFDCRHVVQSSDRAYRDSDPMTVGQRIGLIGVTVEITAVTDDGRPAEATVHFAMNRESPLFRWLQWEDGAYVPFELPAVEDTVTRPAAPISFERGVARDGHHVQEEMDA